MYMPQYICNPSVCVHIESCTVTVPCTFFQSASVGGAAHLVNFQGTDTIASLIMARDYYGSSKIAGVSIPAAEHSTITSWTKEGEVDAFRNMLTKVSDDWHFYNNLA